MARYRSPQPKSSLYISAEGYQALQDELEALWQRRHHVTKALAAAAAEGDRSENAEYIYRKKELREIDPAPNCCLQFGAGIVYIQLKSQNEIKPRASGMTN